MRKCSGDRKSWHVGGESALERLFLYVELPQGTLTGHPNWKDRALLGPRVPSALCSVVSKSSTL